MDQTRSESYSSEWQRAKQEKLIEHYFEAERYNDAVGLIRESLAEDPRQAYLHYLWGVIAHLQDSHEEALGHLDDAWQLGYPWESVLYHRGLILLAMKRWVQSEEALLGVLRENPNNGNAYAVYSYLMMKMGLEDKAKKLMKEALRLSPQSPTVHRYNHLMKLAKRDQDGQVLALEQLVRTSDNIFGIHVHAGLTAYYAERYREAQEHFRDAFLLDPQNRAIQEILEELDHNNHPLMAPLIWMDRIGGPGAFMLLYMAIAGFLYFMGWHTAFGWFVGGYVAFVVYSWTVPFLLKKYRR